MCDEHGQHHGSVLSLSLTSCCPQQPGLLRLWSPSAGPGAGLSGAFPQCFQHDSNPFIIITEVNMWPKPKHPIWLVLSSGCSTPGQGAVGPAWRSGGHFRAGKHSSGAKEPLQRAVGEARRNPVGAGISQHRPEALWLRFYGVTLLRVPGSCGRCTQSPAARAAPQHTREPRDIAPSTTDNI